MMHIRLLCVNKNYPLTYLLNDGRLYLFVAPRGDECTRPPRMLWCRTLRIMSTQRPRRTSAFAAGRGDKSAGRREHPQNRNVLEHCSVRQTTYRAAVFGFAGSQRFNIFPFDFPGVH